ncbi:AAA family ATPase [Acetobacter fallax]|uniref:AAA family ATPase n=1 Tax=Acetobacter fallax TaxID=1737473 RepID=A0ABX0KET7_9PROT|nr:AAA family ATPase [Acetobacter fallax]NHO33626.1 AAA family ATPase [Acetobacter fallax]NHO37213.1 AAA family ATPase [Acetobacter fallax]
MNHIKSLELSPALDGSKKKSPHDSQIQAFVSEPTSENILREVLDEFQPGNFSLSCLTCAQATTRLRRGATPKILIIDVAGEDQPITCLVELANTLEPDVKVLVIGDRQDANFYRQLTRGLGVAEYLYKPLNRSMVARFFGPFLTDGDYEPETTRGGRVLGFLSARGGAGATTIAANLAWYLGEIARRHTLILDANLYTGSVSVLLGTKADGGLRTAFESPQRVDELFIERSAQKVSERCDVLSSQVDLSEFVVVSSNGPEHLIGIVKKKYNFIVIDIPNCLNEVDRNIIDMCDQRVIVLDPTLPSLRDTLRLMAASRNGTHGVRPLIVLNKFGQPGSLSLTEIADGLGRQPDVIIPFLPKIINESEISGYAAVQNKSAFRSSIETLAQEAASVSASGKSTEQGPLRRLVTGFIERIRK